MEQHREQLHQGALRIGVSGIFHYGMRWDLFRTRCQRCGCGQPAHSSVVGCGIYRYPLFQPFQDRLPLKKCAECPLIRQTAGCISGRRRSRKTEKSGHNAYGNISSSAKRFKRHQDKSGDESYKTPAYLFWGRSGSGHTVLPCDKRGIGYAGICAYHGSPHAAIFLSGNV